MHLKPSLVDICGPIEDGLDKVQDTLFEILTTENPLSGEVIQYFFSNKGKYLRPALCLFGASFGSAHAVTGTALRVAAAFEAFHCATLIHDDIVDQSYLRRNMPTVNAKWGPQVAVLVGDYLHDRALQVFFGTKNDLVIDLFLKTASEVCDGEILEFREKNNYGLNEGIYLNIIQKKTASLLAACIEAGAVLGGLPTEKVQALSNYGKALGMAFQVVDDCLDFMGEAHEFGKTLGADYMGGVLTLPLIRLLSGLTGKKRQEVEALFGPDGNPAEKLTILKTMITESGALEYSLAKARSYTEEARTELLKLEVSDSRKSLEQLLDFIVERSR